MEYRNETERTELRRKIDLVIKHKGEAWVIAALVDGSIGYYSPHSAKIALEDYQRGSNESWAERSMACFHCDLLKEILHDIKGFARLRTYENGPARQDLLIQFVQKSMNISDYGFNGTFSCTYLGV